MTRRDPRCATGDARRANAAARWRPDTAGRPPVRRGARTPVPRLPPAPGEVSARAQATAFSTSSAVSTTRSMTSSHLFGLFVVSTKQMLCFRVCSVCRLYCPGLSV